MFRRIRSRLMLALALPLAGCGYNSIQSLDEQAGQAKQNIEVQLQRRSDLIPNLVATVKGYAQQEANVLIEVARAQAVLAGALGKPGGSDPKELANANEGVTRALVPFFSYVQQFPQLKSDQQFLRLQDELSGTENRIAVARTDYNTAVRQYNEYIRKFPAVLTAKATGAKPREYFEVTDAGARTAPKVDFGTPGSSTAPGGVAAPAAPGAPAPGKTP